MKFSAHGAGWRLFTGIDASSADLDEANDAVRCYVRISDSNLHDRPHGGLRAIAAASELA